MTAARAHCWPPWKRQVPGHRSTPTWGWWRGKRARREMHLFGRWKLGGKAGDKAPRADRRSFMHLLWPGFAQAIKDSKLAAVMASGPPAADAPQVRPLLRLMGAPEPAVEARALPAPAATMEHGLADAGALALGEALHRWLQLLHDHGPGPWQGDWRARMRPALASSLRLAGAPPSRMTELLPQLCGMLDAVLKEPGRFMPAGNEESYAEVAFCRAEGSELSRHVLDRLLREPDGAWRVLDYKTSGPGTEGRRAWSEQLARYREIVEVVTGRGQVKATVLRISAGQPGIAEDVQAGGNETID